MKDDIEVLKVMPTLGIPLDAALYPSGNGYSGFLPPFSPLELAVLLDARKAVETILKVHGKDLESIHRSPRALLWAAQHGSLPVMNRLLTFGFRLNPESGFPPEFLVLGLIAAGKTREAKLLIKSDPRIPPLREKEGQPTLLDLAVALMDSHGPLHLPDLPSPGWAEVQSLITLGAQPGQPSTWRALSGAVAQGLLPIEKLAPLFWRIPSWAQRKFTDNRLDMDPYYPALELMARREVLESLWAKRIPVKEWRFAHRDTLLHQLALDTPRFLGGPGNASAKDLLNLLHRKMGIPLNALDQFGRPAIAYAADPELRAALLKAGSPTTWGRANKATVLHAWLDALDTRGDYGHESYPLSGPKRFFQDPLVGYGVPKELTHPRIRPLLNSSGEDGRTPLTLAIFKKLPEAASLWDGNDAIDPNQSPEERAKEEALSQAMAKTRQESRKVEVKRFLDGLIHAGCDPGLRDQRGFTPFEAAVGMEPGTYFDWYSALALLPHLKATQEVQEKANQLIMDSKLTQKRLMESLRELGLISKKNDPVNPS